MIDTDRLLAVMPARGERLHRQDRVRPHLAPLDRVEHLAAEDEALEAGRGRGQDGAGQRAGGEHGDGRRGVAPRGAEGLRERARVEGEHAAALAPPAGVDQVVGAAEELIQVGGEAPAARIFTRRGEVGRGLAVQLRQLAEVAGRERADVAALARRDQRFEPRPVRFPFLHPVHGESR